MSETAILSSAYFGPVQWYQKLNRYRRCLVEQHDHFVKQTYRNRCLIATTQGVQALTVPVESPAGTRIDKTEVKDVRISDHGAWRHLHWQALLSAYGESPFFEFYADDIRPFFERDWTFLLDFDMAITAKMCELLDVRPNVSLTREYVALPRDGQQQRPDDTDGRPFDDFREAIRPKHPLPDPDFTPKPYYQVYAGKHGFIANLSILDLLFNMGNEAVLYL